MIDGERQLIERAIRGETSAFGLLYDQYQPRIYRFIYLKVSHREEAEDLTHQVFLESWRKITEYRHQGFPFSAWLYRIARNEVIDYYRTKKTHITLEVVQDEDQAEIKLETSLFEAVEQTISIERIKMAIQKLKPLDQDIIILRFVEDLSPQEVGLLIERTPEAVRVLQHRAIKNLKNILNAKQTLN